MGDRGLTQEDYLVLEREIGARPQADQAGRATPRARAGLGHTATILRAAAMDLPGLILIGFLVMIPVMA